MIVWSHRNNNADGSVAGAIANDVDSTSAGRTNVGGAYCSSSGSADVNASAGCANASASDVVGANVGCASTSVSADVLSSSKQNQHPCALPAQNIS